MVANQYIKGERAINWTNHSDAPPILHVIHDTPDSFYTIRHNVENVTGRRQYLEGLTKTNKGTPSVETAVYATG
ncbi:hypothetical protein [Ulvibacterium sp.]|uniref:hypothetical protein n=1 Tax=Ulvibacterium sp. TaxID=2665914 RepID=UPI003BA97AB4